jgi:hypothetical protein
MAIENYEVSSPDSIKEPFQEVILSLVMFHHKVRRTDYYNPHDYVNMKKYVQKLSSDYQRPQTTCRVRDMGLIGAYGTGEGTSQALNRTEHHLELFLFNPRRRKTWREKLVNLVTKS